MGGQREVLMGFGSEDEFQAIFQRAAVGLAQTEPKTGRFLRVNPKMSEITGYSEDELLGMTFSQLTHPEDRAAEQRAFAEIQQGRTPDYAVRKRYVRKDGRVIWVEVNASVMTDADGHPVSAAAVIRDITEDHDTREALEHAQAQLGELADAMPQIVWAARPDGIIDYYNRRWYEMTGRQQTADASREPGWATVLHPDDVAHSQDTWMAAVRSGRPYEVQLRFRDRRTGGYRWHLGRALPMRDASARIVRWFGTCTDIDRQKSAEAALRDTHTQKESAFEQLRDADRRKNEFLAMLAHELRNPLAPILNALEVVRLTGTSGESFQRVREMVDRQVRHLARLVDALLDVSRIHRNQVDLQRARIDLDALLQTLHADAQLRFEAAGQTLRYVGPGVRVWIMGDAARLSQVLDNLLSNALKFSPRGGEVILSLETDTRDAIIQVSDMGAGIDRDMLPRLFQAFAQADRSLDRKHGGLGLGLAVARGLVELHEGRIEAHSDGLGRGSTFTVRLPLGAPPMLTPVPARPIPTTGDRRLRVLVVEDNLDAAESLQLFLELSGYDVTVTHNGPDGVEAARRVRPHVVLCDVGLPGMDGYAVASALRHDPVTASARLIAITGYGREEDRQKALESGFDEHLVKPVEPELVRARLAAVSAGGEAG